MCMLGHMLCQNNFLLNSRLGMPLSVTFLSVPVNQETWKKFVQKFDRLIGILLLNFVLFIT